MMAYPRRGYCKALAVRTGANQAAYAAGWIYYPAGTYGVVFKSTDFGATWDSLPRSLPDTVFGVMADDAGGPGIFCAAMGGVYRSTDEGQSWQCLLARGGMRAVARHAERYAAAGDSGVWLSTDRGSTWARLDSGLGSKRVNCLEFMSGMDGWLWLLAGTQGHAVYGWDFGPTGIAGPRAVSQQDLAIATVCRNRLPVSLAQPAEVRLLDAAGRIVLAASLPPGRGEMDVSALPGGLYFLHCASGVARGASVAKVLIQR